MQIRRVLTGGLLALSLAVASFPALAGENGFVASKNGKAFYPAGHQLARKIKPENLVQFSTRAEAEQAGYTLCKKCGN